MDVDGGRLNLALPLFVAGILADDADDALAPHDAAGFTLPLD
jgi:hypothetical protein